MLLAVATALLLVLSHVFRWEASAKTQHTKNKRENAMTAENTTTSATTATETAYRFHPCRLLLARGAVRK